jgi:hypothetical protein
MRFKIMAVSAVLGLALAFRPSLEAGDSKAVTLFNGKDLSGWKIKGKEDRSKWAVGSATVNDKGQLVFDKTGTELVNTQAGGVDISSEKTFGDCVIVAEVMVPKGSNSGIYVMGEYEVQIFDSFGKEKLTQGDMGAIYSAAAAKVNACKKPGEWQKYIIDFKAPRFENGKKVSNAVFVKVELNGTVIHENVEMKKGATPGGLTGKEMPAGPLMFQGDHGTVAFRNITVTAK